jgi:F-type H+/Na+-transporting ATPase subunit alpha
LLKQPESSPFEVIDQCIAIFAGTRGFLDDVPRNKVAKFEEDLLDYFRGPKKDLRDKLAGARSFKGIEDDFKEALREFKANWSAG